MNSLRLSRFLEFDILTSDVFNFNLELLRPAIINKEAEKENRIRDLKLIIGRRCGISGRGWITLIRRDRKMKMYYGCDACKQYSVFADRRTISVSSRAPNGCVVISA
jgi:hypothetical protein